MSKSGLLSRIVRRKGNHEEIIGGIGTLYGEIIGAAFLLTARTLLPDLRNAETRRYITVIQTAPFEFAEQDRVVLTLRVKRGLR